jgi:hypothetical protein
MIPGRHCDRTSTSLRRREVQEPVEGSAFLERSRKLLILELEVQLHASDPRKRLGPEKRRRRNSRSNALAGAANVV